MIELARLLEPCDKQGRPRTARQVKQDVKQFLEGLEQEAAEQPDDAEVIACLVKAVRNRWWGLFTCYRVPNVPSSNNDLETFFKDMKHHQRRITGRKSVHEFILRYGPFAAFIDYAESGMIQVRLTNCPQAIFVPELGLSKTNAQGDDLWVHDEMIYPAASGGKLPSKPCRSTDRGAQSPD